MFFDFAIVGRYLLGGALALVDPPAAGKRGSIALLGLTSVDSLSREKFELLDA